MTGRRYEGGIERRGNNQDKTVAQKTMEKPLKSIVVCVGWWWGSQGEVITGGADDCVKSELGRVRGVNVG